MKRLIHVLLFSGFCLFIQSISSQQGCEYSGYVFIHDSTTWDEARAYCRHDHFDLITVENNDVWTHLLKAVHPALTSFIWTGLYKNINGWLWSREKEKITFFGWKSGQPDTFGGGQNCVYLALNGWVDQSCGEQYAFFCYNENQRGARRFVLNTNVKTWSSAVSYCRWHHTDLATIRTRAENQRLKLMMKGVFRAWIGLYRDSWRWSDGTNVKTISWMSGQPDMTTMNRPCGAVGLDGRINDWLCKTAFPFICTLHSRKQIVRLKVKSGENVNDPAVMDDILHWIKQKLKDHGLEKDTGLTWRLQTDGDVFSINHDREDCAEL